MITVKDKFGKMESLLIQ